MIAKRYPNERQWASVVFGSNAQEFGHNTFDFYPLYYSTWNEVFKFVLGVYHTTLII